jgi:hypothetical protein
MDSRKCECKGFYEIVKLYVDNGSDMFKHNTIQLAHSVFWFEQI